MRLDDAPRGGEAEPRAFALGREEGVEDARADGLGDAAPSVVDVDDDAHPVGPDADVDAPPLRPRLARVAQEVQERLPELRLVEERGLEVRLDVELDRAARELDLGPGEGHDLPH